MEAVATELAFDGEGRQSRQMLSIVVVVVVVAWATASFAHDRSLVHDDRPGAFVNYDDKVRGARVRMRA